MRKLVRLMKQEKIFLTDDLVIGKGHHKIVYADPRSPGLCIKFPLQKPDYDLERELAYRKARSKRNLPSEGLSGYYGTVETNLGTGYVFERIMNYDGTPSVSVAEFLRDGGQKNTEYGTDVGVYDVLVAIRKCIMDGQIVISDTNPENFYIKWLDRENFRIKVIDNIGYGAYIPIAYYFGFVARRRIERFWRRMIREIKRDRPDAIDEETAKRLKDEFNA